MAGSAERTDLLGALRMLRQSADAARLPLHNDGVEQARRERAALLAQLDDYLLPRLERQDAPLLAVIGGSTGAGKSTLVNTLVGRAVSRSGVLRPTTRSPVLVMHPDDEHWFLGDRVLPGLSRVHGGDDGAHAASIRSLRLVAAASMPSGMALLDAPDIDSVVSDNRELAGQLLAAADLWLFVTTAARYADAVPWELLRTARERATALAVVIDRVPPEAIGEVDRHLRELLDSEGLAAAPLLMVPEAGLVDGLLPADAVAAVRTWLDDLATDAARRAAVIRSTLAGAVHSLQGRGALLAGALEAQQVERTALHAAVDDGYAQVRASVDRELRDGRLLRGEVLARWQELIGTGELMRTLESRLGRVRDRVKAAVTGRPSAAQHIEVALESSLQGLLRDGAERAAATVSEQWVTRAAGRALVDADPQLRNAGPLIGERVHAVVTAWQGEVLDLVRAQGGDRRQLAKLASYGVNGAGSVLIVALFAQTGGLTGGEVAIAGGTAVVSQKVLEAIFGDQAVRALAADALAVLLRRVDELMDAEGDRFRAALDEPDGAMPTPTAGSDAGSDGGGGTGSDSAAGAVALRSALALVAYAADVPPAGHDAAPGSPEARQAGRG